MECCEKLDVQIELNVVNDAIIEKQDSVALIMIHNQNLLTEAKNILTESIILVNENAIKITNQLATQTKRKKRWRRIALVEGVGIVSYTLLKILIK